MKYEDVFLDVERELARQRMLKLQGKFRNTCEDIEPSEQANLAVLAEEFGEVAKAVCEYRHAFEQDEACPHKLEEKFHEIYKELIQVAAVCMAWASRFER